MNSRRISNVTTTSLHVRYYIQVCSNIIDADLDNIPICEPLWVSLTQVHTSGSINIESYLVWCT
jgi:hypothetical protein